MFICEILAGFLLLGVLELQVRSQIAGSDW